MVQMFPTIFDDTLQHLSVTEKHPVLSQFLHRCRNMKFYQAELRFLRMFLWCFPDCDANLLARLNFIAINIAVLYKFEGANFFALAHAEYYSLARKVEEEVLKCEAEMNKYRQHLILCSLKGEPFTSDETIGFLDSVHVNLNDLLKYCVKEFLNVDLMSQLVEALQERVFLLRNLVYYTPMEGENYDDMSFLSLSHFDANLQNGPLMSVHDWANKEACLSLLCWLTKMDNDNEIEDAETGMEDDDEIEDEETEMEDGETGMEDEENIEEIRRLYIDLQQKVDPCNPEFIKLCFQNLKVPKMKREDRLLFGEFVFSI